MEYKCITILSFNLYINLFVFFFFFLSPKSIMIFPSFSCRLIDTVSTAGKSQEGLYSSKWFTEELAPTWVPLAWCLHVLQDTAICSEVLCVKKETHRSVMMLLSFFCHWFVCKSLPLCSLLPSELILFFLHSYGALRWKIKKYKTKKKPVLIMYPDPYGSHSTIRIRRTTAKKISDLCVCICVRENICISFMIFYIFLTYSTSIDYLKEHWLLKRSEVDSGKFLKLSQKSIHISQQCVLMKQWELLLLLNAI